MSQQVQELINKIKSEGVQSAEQKAREIETKAQAKAEQIVRDARLEAEKIVNEGKSHVKKMEESTQMALKQASRDTLLSLKKNIQASLQKIIATEVGQAMSGDKLAELISDAVKGVLSVKKDTKAEVVVSADDLKKLEATSLEKLKAELKGSFTLKASDDSGKGFLISFDEGKSSFDFSDASLAEYLGGFVNNQVAELLK